MRLIKMLGASAVAAIAAMAFFGASSAMATSTVLCKVNQLVCPSGSEYTGTVVALATSADLLTSVEDVHCTHSEVEGSAGKLAKPLKISVSSLSFSGCDAEVVVTDETGEISALKTAANLATGTAKGFAVLVDTGFFHCVYGGVAEGAHGLGGKLGSIVASGVQLDLLSGFFCPSTSEWDASYSVTTPDEFYIAE